jgi:DNA-binding MarR family transcriptional regulator/GNAT superfamily N-acetyltransferase
MGGQVMDDILVELGPLVLGSRLKRLGERLQADAQAVLAAVGTAVAPGDVGLLAALDRSGPLTVSQAAQRLGISQPALTRIAQGLEQRGEVEARPLAGDRRARAIHLTARGAQTMATVRAQVWTRLGPVVEDLCGGPGSAARLLATLAGVEEGLAQRTMLARMDARVRVVPWSEERAGDMARAFHDINAAWISAMFGLEDIDRRVLGDPRTHILNRGGSIWFAESDDHGLIGTCALMPVEPHAGTPGAVELTKMGVREDVRGRKAGEFLLSAVLQEARKRPDETLFLLTNSACAPAIHLYEKHGFRHDADIMRAYGCEYARCDVAMRYHPPED